MKLVVLYPQPTDSDQFESDYAEHVLFLHDKLGIPLDVKPYVVTKFLPSPAGLPPFYQMFTMPFASMEELSAALASAELQAVAADANRISSGGAPHILIGEE